VEYIYIDARVTTRMSHDNSELGVTRHVNDDPDRLAPSCWYVGPTSTTGRLTRGQRNTIYNTTLRIHAVTIIVWWLCSSTTVYEKIKTHMYSLHDIGD